MKWRKVSQAEPVVNRALITKRLEQIKAMEVKPCIKSIVGASSDASRHKLWPWYLEH